MIHTLTLSFPENLFIKMQDILGTDEKDTIPKFTQFLTETFAQFRMLKHNATMAGRIPLQNREISLAEINRKKTIPSDSTYRVNKGKNVFKYDWRVGSKTYEALEFFCRFSSITSTEPIKCMEQVLSAVAIEAAAKRIQAELNKEFEEEDKEVNKSIPEKKQKNINNKARQEIDKEFAEEPEIAIKAYSKKPEKKQKKNINKKRQGKAQ